jgi:flagellar hook protein FlgE
MAVFGALAIGQTGLINQSAAMSVIGNNIANVNTVGFKGSRVEFADLLSASGGGQAGKIGLGSKIGAVRTLFEQGVIENTGRDKDLAIDGEGFFVVGDTAAPVFTRAGNFTTDRNGDLVTLGGLPLLARPVDPTTGLATGQPQAINIFNLNSSPQATANMTVAANLDANGAIPSGGFDDTSFTTAYQTSTHQISEAVFDSLGGVHSATIFFTRTDVNEWRYDVAFDGGEVEEVGGVANTIGAGVPVIAGNGTIDFNPDGSLAAVTVTNQTDVTFNGADPQTVDYDFGTVDGKDGLTQHAETFATRFQSQDGFGSGELLGLDVTDDGFVEALFTNGETRPISQLVLGRFANTEGLTPLGDGIYRESTDSGSAFIDAPLTGGRGSIVGGALETSNVSLSKQFIDIITAQRSFQANTRVITSSDQLLVELLNIVR